ncbi:lachesin [Aplysia californica]|uniref:Lachesin n=1 Tax=Aplysia californica TaxID=6500 RepID=A0ABM0JTV5_APLCA|nr:lachesin [Aplysia californica]
MSCFVYLAVFTLVLCGNVFAQDPEIVDEIWPEVQPLGRTGRLNCTVAKLGNNMVEWYHEDSAQTISIAETIDVQLNPMMGGLKKYEVRVRRKDDRQTHMLIVRRLRQQDAGTYICKIRVVGKPENRWTKKKGQLTVQVAPTIRDGPTTAVLEVSNGANSSLRCQATGIPYPNITWTRSDGGLLPLVNPVAQYRSPELPLVNVNVHHMGVYRCVADNNIKPPAEHLAELRVFHAPITRVVQNSVGQAQNRRFSAKLECIVQGHPEPTLTFKRRAGIEILAISDDDKFEVNKQTTDNQNLKAMEQWYTLKVKNVQANDYTDYYCVANNVFGSANSTIKLFETTECQGSNCPSLPPSRACSTAASVFVTVFVGILSYLYCS